MAAMQRLSSSWSRTSLHASSHSLVAARSPVTPGVQLRKTARLVCSSVEATTPAVVADAEAQAPKEVPAAVPTEKENTHKQPMERSEKRKASGAKTTKDKKPNDEVGKQTTSDREVIQARCRLLLQGEAVGLTMAQTPADLAVGFKGLRPLSQELRRKERMLLFFPSTVNPDAGEDETSRGYRDSAAEEHDVLQLALVAVPRFTRVEPDTIIRVGAMSDPSVISRLLARALIRSTSVVIQAAGPAAALVALQSAVGARRALGQEHQLDLAFSLEYLKLPAYEAAKTDTGDAAPAAVEAAPASAPAAAPAAAEAPAAVTPVEEGADEGDASSKAAGDNGSSSGRTPLASVLQFSFYKRALPTPEVLVADFAQEGAIYELTELLTALMSERLEVDVVVSSQHVLFFMQSLTRVVRRSWFNSKASVGAFLTSLEVDPEEQQSLQQQQQQQQEGEEQDRREEPDRLGDSSSSDSTGTGSRPSNPRDPNIPSFTARLQLRRLAGAPNFVGLNGDGLARNTVLGPPVGTVKYNSPVGPLSYAIARELATVGVYSLLPVEGLCMPRVLLALWETQQSRAKAAESAAAAAAAAAATAPVAQADADATTEGAVTPAIAEGAVAPSAASAASPRAAASVVEIAIIPEAQDLKRLARLEGRQGDEGDGRGGRTANRRRYWQQRSARSRGPGREGGYGEGRKGVHEGQRHEDDPSTVLHLLEVTPQLSSTLRLKKEMRCSIYRREQLLQLTKAVALRNRMYGSRPGGKTMVMTPQLDEAGNLQVKVQYVDSDRVNSVQSPPTSGEAARRGGDSSSSRDSRNRSSSGPNRAAFNDAVDVVGGFATDDEYGVGAEAAVLIPHGREADGEEQRGHQREGASGGPNAKSPWVIFQRQEMSSLDLAMSIVAETCKRWERYSPAWLRLLPRTDLLGTAALAVAMAQPQVRERVDVGLHMIPCMLRRRDDFDRPYNALILKLVKFGPGAEPGAASALTPQALGPSDAAMQAAAAAAARVVSRDNGRVRGARKLW